jgi:hypothetical protein
MEELHKFVLCEASESHAPRTVMFPESGSLGRFVSTDDGEVHATLRCIPWDRGRSHTETALYS